MESPEKREFSQHHQNYRLKQKLVDSSRAKARANNGLASSVTDILRSSQNDPQGWFIDEPKHKTRAELVEYRNKNERAKMAETTAKGIAVSLEARRIQDLEDRKREPEEMSTIGLEVDLEVKPRTMKEL